MTARFQIFKSNGNDETYVLLNHTKDKRFFLYNIGLIILYDRDNSQTYILIFP